MDTAARHDRLRIAEEARSWLGTPYRECAGVKGDGADCAMLLVQVFANCGFLPRDFDPRPYDPRFHFRSPDELYLRWVAASGATPALHPGPGDVAIYRFGRSFSHGAIVVDDDLAVVHAYVGTGVTLTRQGEAPLAGRQVHYWGVFNGR